MITIRTIEEMQKRMIEYRQNGKTIGFVPTMGYLHEGHVALLQEARKANDIVVLSIFVNPLQFGPNEDFDRYPRDFARDEKIAKEAGVDVLFYPDVKEMYPNEPSVIVTVKERVDVLCGKSRPGHFDGVATVVTKLFNIVMPHRAYFGMKDAQQVAVIDGLIRDFHFPIELIAVPTVREADGLAKSSRNVYLSEQERKEAPVLYASLQKAKALIEKGERNVETIRQAIITEISTKTSGTIDYVDIYSYPDLKPLDKLAGNIIIAIAVRFTNARLIDNIVMNVK
ncbi:pantoate--beta-alanine ligase [Thermolongibacillus altinsuensis]|uniref:pantoate--beta-alanine ligase n=1 Tax=Thermolongibacillus altinsuensis TaxID=575256 RepID=UPI00242A2DB8|nr:pantoate--beta-alanine ligase [Thermolongibacillus altinsuensis]GMB07904.1 pantothenate synthetase [Thermolongibacillus altinsuensis]